MFGKFLDVTSLTGKETEQDIVNLCYLAMKYEKYVAAVCIYPKWVKFISQYLKSTNIKVATVLNFPEGNNELKTVINTGNEAYDEGASEVDIVLPYTKSENDIGGFLLGCDAELNPHLIKKYILETSELNSSQILTYSRMCMEHGGANFIKTSTGKKGPATTEAVKLIAEQIKDHYLYTDKKVGIKISGGVKTFQLAMEYWHIVRSVMQPNYMEDKYFRIGAGIEGSKHILEHM